MCENNNKDGFWPVSLVSIPSADGAYVAETALRINDLIWKCNEIEILQTKS